ncbi:MAG: hypothetical protein WBE98_12605, partial [Gammaproteobacteria bacterium]
IHGLDASGPTLGMRGSADIETEGRYATRASLEWRVVLGDAMPIIGELSATGGLDALDVRVHVEPPYTLDAELVVRNVIERPAIDGTIRGRLEPAAAGWETPVADASTEISLAGPIDELAFDARGGVDLREIAELRIATTGRWLGDALDLEALDLSEAVSGAALSLSGRVDLSPQIDIRLRGAWRDVVWPTREAPVLTSRRGDIALSGTFDDLLAELSAELGVDGRVDARIRRVGERFDAALEWRDLVWPQEDRRLVSEHGRLDAAGTFDAYRFALDSAIAAIDRPAGLGGRIEAEGAGDRDGLEIERLDAAVLDGALSGRGRIAWAPAIEADVELDGTRLDPGVLFPDWRGQVDASLRASAVVGEDEIRADIEGLRLAGALRGRPIEIDASGAYDGSADATIERLHIVSGASRASARGRIGRELDVEWLLDSANLEDLWPGLGGRLTTSGRARGPITRPIVVAAASGGDIAFGESRVESLRLDANVDARGRAESNVELEVRGAHGFGHVIERLDLAGSGNAAAHRLSAAVASNGAEVALSVVGALERPWEPDYEWRFELEEGSVAYGELAAWQLVGPATGALSAQGAALSEACWRSGEATFCVEAARTDDGSSVRAALDDLALRYFEPYLPEDAVVVGTVSARAAFELPRDARLR